MVQTVVVHSSGASFRWGLKSKSGTAGSVATGGGNAGDGGGGGNGGDEEQGADCQVDV